jgi:hypothetical protein
MPKPAAFRDPMQCDRQPGTPADWMKRDAKPAVARRLSATRARGAFAANRNVVTIRAPLANKGDRTRFTEGRTYQDLR